MRVLVTGGAGFVGSHIVDRYVDMGYDVHIVDNLTSLQIFLECFCFPIWVLLTKLADQNNSAT